MTSALVHVSGLKPVRPLVPDLEAAGIVVLGVCQERSKLVQEVVRHAPDVVICDDALPGEALFKATRAIADTVPRPVIVFTTTEDADTLAEAVAAGIHAYVVNGYQPTRLRVLVHLAQARFRHEQALQLALQDVSSRFEERKSVERAKGILMRARQVSDDDAFQMLRTVSMHTNQRLGQVSDHIIHSAHFAESVNRAGQLRMLSQRLVKVYLQQLCQVLPGQSEEQLAQSVQRVDTSLVQLGKSLSQATYGDLLAKVDMTWGPLKQALHAKASQGLPEVAQINAAAQRLLQDAERLTAQLENSGAAAPLRVLNMAGRQRMLSQRFAKGVLLALLADDQGRPEVDADLVQTQALFEQAMTYLNGIPLTTSDIRGGLGAARTYWQQMLSCAQEVRRSTGSQQALLLEQLARASEGLLEVFEQLSGFYESSMQMLVGS